jgi:hypothetical protein
LFLTAHALTNANSHLLDVILNRKDSPDQRRSLHAHMLRLQKRYEEFVNFAVPDEDSGDADL